MNPDYEGVKPPSLLFQLPNYDFWAAPRSSRGHISAIAKVSLTPFYMHSTYNSFTFPRTKNPLQFFFNTLNSTTTMKVNFTTRFLKLWMPFLFVFSIYLSHLVSYVMISTRNKKGQINLSLSRAREFEQCKSFYYNTRFLFGVATFVVRYYVPSRNIMPLPILL